MHLQRLQALGQGLVSSFLAIGNLKAHSRWPALGGSACAAALLLCCLDTPVHLRIALISGFKQHKNPQQTPLRAGGAAAASNLSPTKKPGLAGHQ
jgi:hypothetical protein